MLNVHGLVQIPPYACCCSRRRPLPQKHPRYTETVQNVTSNVHPNVMFGYVRRYVRSLTMGWAWTARKRIEMRKETRARERYQKG